MSQNEKVLRHLRRTGSISFREAVSDYSIQSLPRRILDLRERGHNITSTWKHHPITKQRYTEYRLASD